MTAAASDQKLMDSAAARLSVRKCRRPISNMVMDSIQHPLRLQVRPLRGGSNSMKLIICDVRPCDLPSAMCQSARVTLAASVPTHMALAAASLAAAVMSCWLDIILLLPARCRQDHSS